MAFKGYNVKTIFTIFSCLLELHISKCGIADYQRIDVKRLLQHNEPHMLFAENKYLDDEKDLEDNVANDNIQKILNNFNNGVNDNDDFDADEKFRALRQNGKSTSDSSDSDSSEEKIRVNSKNIGDMKQILTNVLRSDKRFNVTGGGKNHEQGELGHSDAKDEGSGSKDKLKEDTNVFKNNITLRSSCNKGAAKACKKACQGVLKNVCHEFKCSHGMKSRFKVECKKNCRNKFDA